MMFQVWTAILKRMITPGLDAPAFSDVGSGALQTL
jgi:hypothetical protein